MHLTELLSMTVKTKQKKSFAAGDINFQVIIHLDWMNHVVVLETMANSHETIPEYATNSRDFVML